MHKPIKNYKHALYPEGSITQWFDENPSLYRRFGFKGHTGLDIVAPHGEPILAVEEGLVTDVKYDPEGFGKHVRILSAMPDGKTYREWGYAHLSKIHVVVGEHVNAGEQIGLMGNTGFVVSGATPFWEYNPYAGTHLHLQCRLAEKDPEGWRYTTKGPRINILNYGNGYKGCFDIAPFFVNDSGFENTPKGKQYLTIISLQKTIIGLLQKLIGRR